MNNNKKIFNSKMDVIYFILGIALLILMIYVSIKSAELIVNAIKYVFDEYPTISVALITGLLAFISVPVGKYFENRYNIKNQIREERQEIYIHFLDWLIKNVLNAEINKNKDIVKEIKDNQNKIVFYASDKVLKAWTDLKISALNSEENKKGMTEEEYTKYYLINEAPKIEKLILAIRKELGYKNKKIKQYDILRLYINDIDKYI